MAGNPPLNFSFNAGTGCYGICVAPPGIYVNALATDSSGNTYFTGTTNIASLPTGSNAFQPSFPQSGCFLPFVAYACSHAYVVKLDPSGNVLWATYLGGNGVDSATAIAVDSAGNVFLAGSTGPSELNSCSSCAPNTFPTTQDAPYGPPSPPDQTVGFLTRLSADGSQLVFSTFLPGSCGGNVALAIDSIDNAYVTYQTGESSPVTTSPGAFEAAPSPAANGTLVLKVNTNPPVMPLPLLAARPAATPGATGYATYLGVGDFPMAIAVDSAGSAVVAGYAQSGFPVTAGAYQTTYPAGQQAGFVAKLNASGSGLIYATYLGQSVTAAALDANGDAYVVAVLPPGESVQQVVHLSGDGSALVYSVPAQGVTSVAVDLIGDAYVAGTNPSAAQTVFVERIAPGGAVSGGEVLGGPAVGAPGQPVPINDTANVIAIAPNGSAVISGRAVSGQFPGISEPITENGFVYVASLFISPTIMSAASYVAGPVAPGEIVAIFGYGWGGAETTVNFGAYGVVPIYLSAHQINVQVPWEIAGEASIQMSIVSTTGPGFGPVSPVSTIGPFVVQVAPSAPGVFFVNNSDGTTNSASNPASRGDFISIYGTGGGLMNPAGVDGANWPLSPLSSMTLPVSVSIGGASANLIYAGSAPTLLSGFFQINAGVPVNIAPSSNASLVLTIGAASTTVPVAIR